MGKWVRMIVARVRLDTVVFILLLLQLFLQEIHRLPQAGEDVGSTINKRNLESKIQVPPAVVIGD